MRELVRATKMQHGVVADVFRGSHHLYITVPPPGFSQQGTRTDAGPQAALTPVAAVTAAAVQPQPKANIAIMTAGPEPNGAVAGETAAMVPYLIVVNCAENIYTVLANVPVEQLGTVCQQYQVKALMVSSISTITAARLAIAGIEVYSGLQGTATDVVRSYQAGALMPVG